jgi:hypothetical protein
MIKYTISIDEKGAPKVNDELSDKNNIADVIISNSSQLTLGNYRDVTLDNIDEVKANLQGLAEAFRQTDIPTKLVETFVTKEANTATIKDTNFSKALTTLLQWKKQVIKAHVYVTVMLNTDISVDADENDQKQYDQLKEFMKESTRILLNLNVLDDEKSADT